MVEAIQDQWAIAAAVVVLVVALIVWITELTRARLAPLAVRTPPCETA